MAALVKHFWQLSVFAVFLVALYEFIENTPANECEMTYMYEQPEYIPVSLPKHARVNGSRFNLFMYGEGVYAHKLREYPGELEGIPVLFIPGNAGSHRQVRSLASVALRMGTHRNLMTHFNYFSIDFNEELYAFYGGHLEVMTEYVHNCIKHILSLYKKPTKIPKTVILVGHSMGGLLARALFTLPNFDKSSVNLIITQATPHQMPIMYTDYLPDFYKKVNLYWIQEKDFEFKHVTLLSSGGGDRDILVNYYTTRLDDLAHVNRQLSVNTMSVPRAWVSTDHLCSVWCKQMVLATVRAMFDMIDPKTNQITSDVSRRMKVLRHHFLHNPGTSQLVITSKKSISFKQDMEWDNIDTGDLILEAHTAKMDKYFAFVLKPENNHLVLETTISSGSWLFGCNADSRSDTCSEGDDLTGYARLVPTTSKRLYVHLDQTVLHKYTQVVIHVVKTKTPIYLNALLFNNDTESLVYNAPTVGEMVLDFPRSLYHHRDTVITRTSDRAIYKLIQLPTITSMYQAYTAQVMIHSCRQNSAQASFMRLHLPDNKGTDTYGLIRPASGGGNLSLAIQVPNPGGENSPPQLHLYLQPGCVYQLDISIDFLGGLRQFARYYYIMLPAFVIANLFMVLGHQLFLVSRGQACPTVATAQDAYGQPWKIGLITTVLEFILCQNSVSGEFISRGIPVSDGKLLTDRGLMFPILHLSLYSIAFIIVRVYAGVLSLILRLMGAVTRFLFHRIFTHHTIPIIGSLGWWAVLIAGIYSSWNYCGSVGLLITYVLIICDIMSSMVTFAHGDRRHSMWYMQQTMLMLTLCMFILSLPEFVSWIKNYRFGDYLVLDPSRYPSIVIATSLMLVHFSTDQENWYLSYMNSFTPIMLSIGALLYGVLNIWRLNVLVPTVFVWVASVQTFGIILHRHRNSIKRANEDSLKKSK